MLPDTTDSPITWNDPNYNAETGVWQLTAEPGQLASQIPPVFAGFKLMNPQELDNLKLVADQNGKLQFTTNQDQDITLHYAKLSPVIVSYVDQKGNLLLQFQRDFANSTAESPFSSYNDVHASTFIANAIDIPGYELVSPSSVTYRMDQTYQGKDANPYKITFTYKQIVKNAQYGLPNDAAFQGGVESGISYTTNWDNMPGGVIIDTVYPTYGGPNHYEQTKKDLIDRYAKKQGYSWVDVVNDHKDSDKMNQLENGIKIGFYQHQPVVVHYVDEQGNEIAKEDVISFNNNNLVHGKNGVDPANNWYPTGEWQAQAKNLPSYTLKETQGATSGKFTNFTYHVTFICLNKSSRN